MNRRIQVYDSLRGIGTILIFLSHMTFMSTYYTWYIYLENGYYSVVFFFLLSGFVMMLGQRGQCQGRLTWTEEKNFLGRRMKKIYPLYLITMGIFMLYCLVGDIIIKGGNGEIVKGYLIKGLLSVTMLQSLIPFYETALCFNSAAWFLSVLFVLYLFTPCLVRFVNRFGGVRMLLAVLLAFAVVYELFSRFGKEIPDCSLTHTTPYINFFFYVTGMVLAHLYMNRKRMPSDTFCSICELLGAVLCLCVNFMYRMIDNPLVYRLLTVCSLAFLIYILAFEKGILSRLLLRCRVLSRVGRISFEVYLIHYPVCVIGFALLGRIFRPSMEIYLLYFLLFWTVTLLSAVLYRQFASWLRKKISERKAW